MGHRLLWDTSNLLPVNELNVVAHDPVLSSSNNADALLDEVGAIRVLEGGSGYYMATMSGEATGAWGVAWIPGWTSYVRVGEVPQADDALTIAHELGHNLSLYHAPCIAGPPLDPGVIRFPTGRRARGGSIPDPAQDVLVPKTVADLMSYCVPAWIGDYHFTKAARFRRKRGGWCLGTAHVHDSPLGRGGGGRHALPEPGLRGQRPARAAPARAARTASSDEPATGESCFRSTST